MEYINPRSVKCRCDCGAFVNMKIPDLRALPWDELSCGCSTPDYMGKQTQKVVQSIRSSADTRGLEWTLEDSEVIELSAKDCAYCGRPPRQRICRYGPYRYYNGLDRINNHKGYHSDNVVPCCGTCNRAKGTRSACEFYAWIFAVVEHYSPEIIRTSQFLLDVVDSTYRQTYCGREETGKKGEGEGVDGGVPCSSLSGDPDPLQDSTT